MEAGRRRELEGVRFVITLDGDTRLNVGAAAKSCRGHAPPPKPARRWTGRRGVVTAGYGILQPRVGVELEAANKSQFSRIFAGQGGVDPYGSTASDVYHDLFDQGTYTGKGIFDVDAFLTCLDGRFPENRVLSHDLLEGSYLHAGLIGDVELTDGYPSRVTGSSDSTAGCGGTGSCCPGWGGGVRQEAGREAENPAASPPWPVEDLGQPEAEPVSGVYPAGPAAGDVCLRGWYFALAAGVAAAAAASNLLLSGAELFWRGGRGLRERYHASIVAGFGGVILQTLLQLLFLPLHAWTCASAIATALWRQLVTHRGLLAWVTAADAERRAGDGLWANYRKGWSAVAAGGLAILFARIPAGAAAGLLWALAPCAAWAMSRPLPTQRAAPQADRPFLLHQGALIWQYFADWLRPEDHWLPPDNVQEGPDLGPARRTSPTNAGMALLCCLAAADLDLCSRKKALSLIGHLLDTLETLPKWNGHFYNWYDTASAAPLTPRYVSTVDAGNLCACLIALREGLYEWGEGELARRAELLSDAMGFAPLYDRERRLFYMGYDCGAGGSAPRGGTT